MVRPSGLTSNDIHDAFVVLKFTCRPTVSGRSGFLPLPPSACCAFTAGVSVSASATLAALDRNTNRMMKRERGEEGLAEPGKYAGRARFYAREIDGTPQRQGVARVSRGRGRSHSQCLTGEMWVIDSHTITNLMRWRSLSRLVFTLGAATACSSHDASTGPIQTTGPMSFNSNPCSVSGTLQLDVAQAARVDCSNGGTT